MTNKGLAWDSRPKSDCTYIFLQGSQHYLQYMLCQWLACQLRPAPKVKSNLVGGLYWEASLPVLLLLLQA